MYKAEIVADSISTQGHRITTMLVTMPRIILAEFNTHRMLSRNSASSRAIPFEKMMHTVKTNPFIPLKWMIDHKGMQGYDFMDEVKGDCAKMEWLAARDYALTQAKILNREFEVTKQIVNRLLEPFMWHTVLVTATEWENFFALRLHPDAEIHMQHVAQLMLDAMNASEPKLLQPGEWHIPFGDEIEYHVGSYGYELLQKYRLTGNEFAVKIATARAAQTSYTIVGEDGQIMNYEKLIALHDRLLKSGHMSPMEHCARAMTQLEYEMDNRSANFFGWIQYRKILAGENRSDNRLKKHQLQTSNQ